MTQELKNAIKAYKLALDTEKHNAEKKALQEQIIKSLTKYPPMWGTVKLNFNKK
jgi:hypothetical protein